MTAQQTNQPLPMRIDRAPLSEISAEELAVRAKGGNTTLALAAYTELVDRYHGRLYSFLQRRLPAADAEDLTQEAFIRAWQRIETYNPRYRFSTWLFTIGQRLAISHGRRMGSDVGRRELQLSEYTPAPEARQVAQPLDGELRREQQVRIWALVEKILPEEQQTAVWLRYIEGMAIGDIASVLGRTQVSVRVMLYRARALLAQRLERTEDGVAEVDPGSGDRARESRPNESVEIGTATQAAGPVRWSGGAA